jgi:hypothetical protein
LLSKSVARRIETSANYSDHHSAEMLSNKLATPLGTTFVYQSLQQSMR